MEYIKAETIRATASRLEAIEQRVSELGVEQSNRNEELKSATGFLYKKGSNKATFGGVISSQTYNFAKQMLDDMEDHDKIHISVNSPGGSAVTGVALYNLFNQADQEITMTAVGQAYSAAGVMMQGADIRQSAPGGIIGVHRSWCKAQGNAGDFSSLIEDLKKSDENVMEIFSSVVPEGKAEKVKEYMEKDTALTGKQALEVGLIDKILTRKEAKALSKEDKKDETKNEITPVDSGLGNTATQDILNKVDKILARMDGTPEVKAEAAPAVDMSKYDLSFKEMGEAMAQSAKQIQELQASLQARTAEAQAAEPEAQASAPEETEVKQEEAPAEIKQSSPQEFKLLVPVNF